MSPPSRTERALAFAEQHVEAANYMTAEGRYAEAHAQWLKAAAHYADASDPEGQRVAWMKAGLCSIKAQEAGRALDELTQAVSLARAPGGERSLAIALSHLATLHATEGRPLEAAEGWHESLALATTLGDQPLIAAVANNLGRLTLDRGDLDAAQSAYERARQASESIHDLAGLAAADNALGEIARHRGQHEAARDLFERAFESAHQTGDPALMGAALNHLGNALRQLGDLERAEQRFRSALAFANVVGDGLAIARTHTNLGNVAAARGALDDAQRHYTQALALDRRNQQHQAQLGNLVNLANLRATRGDLSGAKKFYEEALAKLPTSAARTLTDLETMLGQLEARLGSLSEAESRFSRALARAEATGYQAAAARLTMNLAAVAHARGDLKTALNGYRQAVGLLDHHASPSDRVMGHLVVADAALARDLLDLAEAALTQADRRLDAMRGEDDGPLREQLDVDAMRARVAFARNPADPTAMEALIERFIETGRTADALGHQLTLYDEAPALLPQRLGRLQESLAWLNKQSIEPLQLELQSLEALATGAPPHTLEPLAERARALQLQLVALRIERRRAIALAQHGDPAAARDLATALLTKAQAMGADAEAARIARQVKT